MSDRDTYKYRFKRGGRVVRSGITNDLDRRQKELQRQHRGGTIEQVGNRTTREAARNWEDNQPKGTPPGG